MSKLNYIWPFFIVSNVKDSVDFYVNKLGFKAEYTGPTGDPFFAIVGRDNAYLMLKAIANDIKPLPNNTRHEWGRWDAFVGVADPDALFEEYNSGGVAFRQLVQNDGDGLRGFEIADVDGYVLFFGRTMI
ncbi:hypothetical protein JN11_04804 [Mucilaginibacter frigoritolerans]|uniref:VOC domain-containing protein n=1 Tax=Mucilaginibacter frigoritolerans TaxID=652788 RepID=A0A562TLT3_9SPHI|nr:VOC family protein [Mucilaginibacter frigoritolerans]TWI94198.1 hypothetical protein JN11_04804 [Mucilaginibacter frigoritolerans]